MCALIAELCAKMQGMETGPQCCISQSLQELTLLALFIIGCLGTAGAFPGGSMIGWITVGLAGSFFVFSLAGGNCGKRIPDLILHGLIAAALVTVGALGGIGILSTTQVGWGVIGTSLAATPIARCMGARRFCKKEVINSSTW
jgi:hypothetical protein